MLRPLSIPERLPIAINLPFRDRWFWLKAGPVLLSALLLAVIWGFTLTRLTQERQLVVDHTSVSHRNLAQIIAENLRQVVDRGAQYALLVGRASAVNAAHLQMNLSSLLAGDRAYNRATLFDLAGNKTFATSPASVPAELQVKLQALIADLRGGQAPVVVVGPIAQAYGELWQLPILLPVRNLSSEFSGVLMLHLDLGYFLRLYQDINIGSSGAIQIVQSNGIELARAHGGGLEISKPDEMSNPLPDGIMLGDTRIAPLFGEGRPHLISLNSVAGYPFVIGVSQELSEVLTDFELRRSKYLVSLFVLTLVVFAMTGVVMAVIMRQRLYVDAVVRSEQEKRALIEQLEVEKQHAYELASSDHLTGLANRRMFLSLAASHLARAQRSRKHYALIFLDLDRFKAINDSLGHHVGDLLLQAVAQRLREELRGSDVIARFGGDEFVILVTGAEREDDIVSIATKLIASIGKPCVDLDGHEVQVSPSIGVALFQRDGQNLDTLIRHADLAMYQSKRAGRGCCTFFDAAMNVNSASDFDLEQRLPRAIEAGEFVLHFQPKMDIYEQRVTGFEALIRWQHPEHGLIFPNDFIPLAESTGHIIDLGNWVIAAACRQLAEWRTEGLSPLPVAINLSGRQLRDKSLAVRIMANMRALDLEPDLLQVEVTESSLIECIEDAGSLLNELVAVGIKVALDDFGNGFSSLGYIKTLPINVIKIDRSFVHDILNSHDDSVIVLSIIALAHNLGMRVVAEGVETRAQLIHLKTGGCDEIQGYYLSRPLPVADVREMIANPKRNLT